MDVNLKTVFFLCQASAGACLPTGGRGKIVNIASLLSFQGGIRVAAYTASKHGVAGITQAARQRMGGKRHQRQRHRARLHRDQQHRGAARRSRPQRRDPGRIPAGRWGEPADIGDAAVFLLAPASDYMHGAVVPVDGGWLAR